MMILIDADAIIDRIDENIPLEYSEYANGLADAIQMIANAPTVDAVPVVWCKDCKHAKHWYRDKYRCFLWSEDGIDVFENGYCSYGERRD